MKQSLLLLALIFAISAMAQICDGNLGENIFTEGDFGEGGPNIVGVNPQIAPGYNYTTSPPPNDGQYTISNDISRWPHAFGWLEPQDNSPDPNGYMLIVNASYTPGLFYEQEVAGLCENTFYEFSADIINLIRANSNVIKPNVSFLIDGIEVYNTGDIPENEKWNTYGFTFTTNPNQTILTLSLQNNAPGGIGNDLAIDNITFRPCGPQARIFPLEIANICEDGSPIDLEATIIGEQYDTAALQWQQSFDEGQTWQNIEGANNITHPHEELSAGFYYYRYLLANGTGNLLNSKCRVVSNVKIVHVVPKFYTIIDTLCTGLSFELGTNQYTRTGVYVDSLKTYIGCDSIVTLNLTIIPDPAIEVQFDLENPSCSYLSDGRIQVQQILNATPPYAIYFQDQLQQEGLLFPNLAQATYHYSLIDRYGCSFETALPLENPIDFRVDIGVDRIVELGAFVQISPSTNYSIQNYNWTPSDLVDCSTDCSTLNFLPQNSTALSLIATSDNGCVATDSIYIQVEKVRKVYIPSVFSPNEDGINDRFTIQGAIPNIQEVEALLIFDRWGELVFETRSFQPNDFALAWDGTLHGRALASGVYSYLTQIRFLDGEILQYEGDLTLLR